MNETVGALEAAAVILIRIGGLGDLLAATPSIALIGRKPLAASPKDGERSMPFKLICRPEYGVLLRETGLVDELIPGQDPALAGLFAGLAPDARARETIGTAALVVGWVQNSKSLLAAADWASLGAREKRFFSPDPAANAPLARDFFDQTRIFLEQRRCRDPAARETATGRPVRRLAHDDRSESSADGRLEETGGFRNLARLPLTEEHIRAGLEHFGIDPTLRGRLAVIHPGSGSRNKRWPLEYFLEIARMLGDSGRPGIIVTGEAEPDLEARLGATPLPPGWRWRGGSPPLLYLAGLLAAAGLYLGNDSGVTHLAAAVGAPSLALFRREWLPAWRPAGRVRILAADDPSDVPISRVWAEIERTGLHPA